MSLLQGFAKNAVLVAILTASTTQFACWRAVPELENAPVVGTWNLSVKNGKDECMTEGWMTGAVSSFDIKLEQFGAGNEQVSAQLQGIAALALWFGVGSTTLTGRIQGDKLDLTLLSERDEMLRGCVYRREISVTTQVKGDRLRDGVITHLFRAPSGPACPGINRCQAVQTFDGTRIDLADAGL